MTSPFTRATGALLLALCAAPGAFAQVSTNRVAADTDWSVFVEESPGNAGASPRRRKP